MLPPPPRHDTLVASDTVTSHTLVQVQDIAQVSTTGLPVIPGYEVISRIGQGGMGRIFKAKHISLDRLVAIKMVAVGAEPHLIARFIDEARAIAKLKHPNIAQVYDTGEVGGQPFFSMELADAGTLAQKLAGQPQDAKEAARLVMTLARAVDYFHQQHILHRDLKPSNILMTSNGEPKIADFGLVKNLGTESKQTHTGDIIGSPSYMAPEQASGLVKTLGPAVDIYALGAILYECLTGRPPFQTPDPMQTLMLVISEEPVTAIKLIPRLSRDLNTICMKCLEKQPGKRYSTAATLADDLERYLQGDAIVARPVGRIEKVWKWCKRRPAWAALILLGFFSLAGFVVGFLRLNEAYRDLNNSKKESDAHLAGARAVIDRITLRYEDLASIPHTESIRQQGLEDARMMYEKLISIRPRDFNSRVLYAESCLRLANIERTLGEFDKADASYQRACTMLDEIIRESDELEHLTRYLGVLVVRANMERDRREMDQCKKFLEQAEPLVQKLKAASQNDAEIARTLGNYYTSLGQTLRFAQQFKPAEEAHRQALAFQTLATKLAGNPSQRNEGLAMTHNNLAAILLFQLQYDEAAQHFAEAVKALPQENLPRLQSMSAMFYSNQAVVYEYRKQWNEAEAAYQQAAKILHQLMTNFPMTPGYRFSWAKVKVNLVRSLVARDLKKTADEIAIVEPILSQLVKDYPQQPMYREQLKILELAKEELATRKQNNSGIHKDLPF